MTVTLGDCMAAAIRGPGGTGKKERESTTQVGGRGCQRVPAPRESGTHPLEERGNLQQVFEFVGGCYEPEPVFNWVRRRKSRESAIAT